MDDVGHRSTSYTRGRRTIRGAATTIVVTVGALLLASCSLLGITEDTDVGPIRTTSAAAVADSPTSSGAVTLQRQTSGTAPRSTPTPWASLTTAPVTTTSSRPELTAP